MNSITSYPTSAVESLASLRHAMNEEPRSARRPSDRTKWGAMELARTAIRARQFARAKSHYYQIVVRAHRTNDQRTAARALCELAFVHNILGELEAAAYLYKQSYAAWRELKLSSASPGFSEYLQFLLDYAEFLHKLGKNQDAYQLQDRVEIMSSAIYLPYLQFSRGERLEARGQDVEAEKFYEEALISAELKQDMELEVRALDRLVVLYRRRGRAETAQVLLERRNAVNESRKYLVGGRRSLALIDNPAHFSVIPHSHLRRDVAIDPGN